MRSRSIKPALYKSDKLVECSFPARYIFPGLWMLADCYGRLENRPKRIRMELLPADSLDVEPLLQELENQGIIAIYGDGQYIWIPGFTRHQNPHPDEKRKGSLLPAHPEDTFRWGQDENPQPAANLVLGCEQPSGNLPESCEQPTNRADSCFPLTDSCFPLTDSCFPLTDSCFPLTDSPNDDTRSATEGELDPPSEGTAQARKPKPDHSEKFRIEWNSIAEECGLAPARSIKGTRLKHFKARWKDPQWRNDYQEALESLKNIEWIRGTNGYGPRGIDWFLNPDTVTKIIEGQFNDRKKQERIDSHDPDDTAGLL